MKLSFLSLKTKESIWICRFKYGPHLKKIYLIRLHTLLLLCQTFVRWKMFPYTFYIFLFHPVGLEGDTDTLYNGDANMYRTYFKQPRTQRSQILFRAIVLCSCRIFGAPKNHECIDHDDEDPTSFLFLWMNSLAY